MTRSMPGRDSASSAAIAARLTSCCPGRGGRRGSDVCIGRRREGTAPGTRRTPLFVGPSALERTPKPIGRAAGTDGPRYVPTVMADKITGHVLASSIAMALYRRERTGHGQALHVPMMETMLSFLLPEHLWELHSCPFRFTLCLRDQVSLASVYSLSQS